MPDTHEDPFDGKTYRIVKRRTGKHILERGKKGSIKITRIPSIADGYPGGGKPFVHPVFKPKPVPVEKIFEQMLALETTIFEIAQGGGHKTNNQEPDEMSLVEENNARKAAGLRPRTSKEHRIKPLLRQLNALRRKVSLPELEIEIYSPISVQRRADRYAEEYRRAQIKLEREHAATEKERFARESREFRERQRAQQARMPPQPILPEKKSRSTPAAKPPSNSTSPAKKATPPSTRVVSDARKAFVDEERLRRNRMRFVRVLRGRVNRLSQQETQEQHARTQLLHLLRQRAQSLAPQPVLEKQPQQREAQVTKQENEPITPAAKLPTIEKKSRNLTVKQKWEAEKREIMIRVLREAESNLAAKLKHIRSKNAAQKKSQSRRAPRNGRRK
ncbi:MAG: hypothetical protein AABY11_03115 [archaeon]